MLTILLIRTGATEYECQGRIQGTLDIPLSEDGRQQVEQVADEVKDLQLETKRLDLKFKTVEGLSNLDHGLWQGMLIDDVKTKQPKVYRQWEEHPETVCPPDGESLSVARDRLQQTLAKLTKKHKSGTLALVVAPLIARLLRNMLREDSLGSLWGVEGADLPQWELIEVSEEVVSHSP